MVLRGHSPEPSLPIDAPLVLLIEDDPAQSAVFQAILADAGYRVVCAQNGREGLALAEQHRPAAVVLDEKLRKAAGVGGGSRRRPPAGAVR